MHWKPAVLATPDTRLAPLGNHRLPVPRSFAARAPQSYPVPPDAAPVPQPNSRAICFFSFENRRRHYLPKFTTSAPHRGQDYFSPWPRCMITLSAADTKQSVIKQNKKLPVKEVVIKMPDTEIKFCETYSVI